mmetsp:Transcript_68750/g.194035  ORF Transcript_68750/g.194035 Transcript_68750/m.194035 type:complete len:353 (+) Transcript_68750:42-1100(+)
MQGIVVLVVRRVPLREETAWIRTTRVLGMRIVQAEVIGRAHLAQALVASHVRREAAEVLCHTQALDGQHEVLHVVLPAQPTTMASIQVDGGTWRHLADALHSIRYAGLVRCNSGRIAAARIRPVCRKVRQGVRLDNQDDRHFVVVLLQHTHDLVNVLGLVLLDTCSTITRRIVVAPAAAVSQVRAADLAIGGFRMTVAIRKVVDNEGHQLRRGLGSGILQDALHGLGALPADLGLGVQPICRGHLDHLFQGRLDLALCRLDGLLRLLRIRWVDIELGSLERVAGLQHLGQPRRDACHSRTGHFRVLRQHLDLEVEPLPGLRCRGLARPRAQAVLRAAVGVVARALRAIRQCL